MGLIICSPVYAIELPYTVVPNLPANQHSKNVNYFDVIMKPGQKQSLEVLLRNQKNTPVVIETSFNRARTNDNGAVDYQATKKHPDITLEIDIEQLVTVREKVIKLEPKEEKIVHLDIDMTPDEFEGILAGALHVREKEEATSSVTEEDYSSVMVENKVAYSLALVLRQKEGTLLAKPIVKAVNYQSSEKKEDSERLMMTIQNPESEFTDYMSMSVKLYHSSNAAKPIVHKVAHQIRLAPNSQFTYKLPLQEVGVEDKAGKYSVETTFFNEKGQLISKKINTFYIIPPKQKITHQETRSPSKLTNFLVSILFSGIIITIVILVIVYLKFK